MDFLSKTKILSCVNNGYLDFALNWLKYIRLLNIQKFVVLYCLDTESYKRLSLEKDIKCVLHISKKFKTESISEFHQKGWDNLMWNKMEAIHQLLSSGFNVLYSDTDVVFLKNPLLNLEQICKLGKYDIAFQVAGGKSICPGFLYAKSNSKTKHLFELNRDDFKRGYIITNENGEIKQRKFKEDMALLNLRLHRAINPDNISYVQLSSNYYPQGVHWERNIKSKGLDKTKKEAYIVHFNCTIGWSNIDEMHANNLQNFDYHQRKIWNMLRYDMWHGYIPTGMKKPSSIIEMKPGILTKEYREQKRINIQVSKISKQTNK